MLEDIFPAAKRIIAEISSSFKRDPKLKSFEIIPQPESQNKSPVHSVEHCLGLESWSVPHIFYYAYRNINEISSKNYRSKFKDPESLSNLLTTALLLNPGIVTFWNLRRQLLELGHLCPCDELHFSLVVLSFKPKCGDVFNYRRWILSKLFKEDPGNSSLVETEFQIVLRAAENYACNYNAWNHCLWCIQFVTSPNELLSLLAQLDTWTSQHVSDHSVLSFRQSVIKRFNALYISMQVPPPLNVQYLNLVSESIKCFLEKGKISDSTAEVISSSSSSIPVGLVLHELLFNSELILRYSGHEALWAHRRFIMFYLFKFFLNESPSSDSNFFRICKFSQVHAGESSPKTDEKLLISSSENIEFLKSEVLNRERKFLDLSTPNDSHHSDKYKKWVNKMLKLNFDEIQEGVGSF
nr:PREDICTED: protein prenyltransferase alpha subunit repeat-containing protein 1 [Bemisia tabaci]